MLIVTTKRTKLVSDPHERRAELKRSSVLCRDPGLRPRAFIPNQTPASTPYPTSVHAVCFVGVLKVSKCCTISCERRIYSYPRLCEGRHHVRQLSRRPIATNHPPPMRIDGFNPQSSMNGPDLFPISQFNVRTHVMVTTREHFV